MEAVKKKLKLSSFNTLQQQCFPSVMSTENLIICAPTNSGKSILLQMAATQVDTLVLICPFKSLCAQTFTQWSTIFPDVQCITGDDSAVVTGKFIITTPEKYTMLKFEHSVLLVDELQTLGDSQRGAVLEQILSRFKGRIVAISATLPNAEELAGWLKGKALIFGEEVRSVPLTVKVIGYKYNQQYTFDAFLDKRVVDLIQGSTLVFCSSRKSCEVLASKLTFQGVIDKFDDKKLQTCVSRGVAYHHAGLSKDDRTKVESLFMKRQIQVICATSTLAAGVNLPCQTVIVKGTTYGKGMVYTDLEVLQMCGRAGRKGFEKRGRAFVLTRKSEVQKYQQVAGGSTPVKSQLLPHLADCLNTLIYNGMTSVEDMSSWFQQTLSYVQNNMTDEYVICMIKTQLQYLIDSGFVLEQEDGTILSKEIGQVAARYCLKVANVKDMQQIVTTGTPMQKVLQTVCYCSDISNSYNVQEMSVLQKLNAMQQIRHPVSQVKKEDKAYLLVQTKLAGINIRDLDFNKSYMDTQDTPKVVSDVSRVIHAAFRCLLQTKDAAMLNACLKLQNSLEIGFWTDSLEHSVRQLNGIGVKLAQNLMKGISKFDDLRGCSDVKLESMLSKNPPFGQHLLEQIGKFPHFDLQLQSTAEDLQVTVSIKNYEQCSKNGHVYVLSSEVVEEEELLLDIRKIAVDRLESKSFKLEKKEHTRVQLIYHGYLGLDKMAELKTVAKSKYFTKPHVAKQETPAKFEPQLLQFKAFQVGRQTTIKAEEVTESQKEDMKLEGVIQKRTITDHLTGEDKRKKLLKWMF